VVRAADAVAMPWRNGGGVTRQYVSHPADDRFDWRVSVAEVAQSGPFSAFPDIDRILVLLSGHGMVLRADGAEVPMRRLDAHRFAGEQQVHAELLDGPTTDLNLFWRRHAFTAQVEVRALPCEVPNGQPGLVFVVEGSAELPDGTVLAAGDLVVLDEAVGLQGAGTAVVFALQPVTGACL